MTDEIEEIIGRLTIAGNANDVVGRTNTAVLMHDAAALLRRLRDERDEARNKAPDEAAAAIDNVDPMLAKVILALKSKEPKSSKETDWGPPVGKETI